VVVGREVEVTSIQNARERPSPRKNLKLQIPFGKLRAGSPVGRDDKSF